MHNLEYVLRVGTPVSITVDPNTNSPKLKAALKVIISLYKNVFKSLFLASPDQHLIYGESTIRVHTPIIMKQGCYPKLNQCYLQSG